MRRVSQRTDPPLPLSCLRLLVPPLQLVSAAIWQTVQQKVVADYGLLDDFVTAVTEMVPELLNRRQRVLLSLGLRTQLTLEMCRPEQTIDLETIQLHLDIVAQLSNTEISDSEDGSSAANLLGLVHTLIKDQTEREHFFQDIFPRRFGDKYSEDIQRLVETFLLRLDKLLTVPKLKQVAHMLSDVPSVLSEGVKCFCQSQELKSLMEYQKNLSQLKEKDDPAVGANIYSALSLPPLKVLAGQEETPLEAKVLTDYMDAFNKVLTVETTTPAKDADHATLESNHPKRRHPETRNSKNHSTVNSEEEVEEEISDNNQHVESLAGEKLSLHSCAVEVQVGYNVEIPSEETVTMENKTPVIDPREQVQALVRITDDSETENCTKEESKEVSTSTKMNKQVRNVSNVGPVRSVRKYLGLKMENLSTTSQNKKPKRGPLVPSTCKTCPTCGKTYSRASDMRRHQRSHTGERPFQCSQCDKCFQFQYDLKRHKLKVCRTAVKQTQNWSSEEPDKNTHDTKQGEVHGQLRSPSSDVSSHENECLIHQKQVVAFSGEVVPPSTERDLQPFSSKVQSGDVKGQSQEPCEGSQMDEQAKNFKSKKKNKLKPVNTSLCCVECNRSFPDTAKLKTHNLSHKPRPCIKCGENYKGFIELSQHYVKVHEFRGPFPCTLCERTYTDLRGLIRHERFHTGDLPFKCSKCPKAFSYASALTLHDRTHTKEAPFLCWDCGKGCKSNAALRIHRLCCHSSSTDKRFCCEHCGKAYALKRSLDLHVAKLHTGVRYPCSHCGKLFRSASSLTRHDLTHTEERPYSCNECGKSFRSTSELKVHTRYHTGERPFKCQDCGKGFVQSYYLTAHMRMHTGEKPYRCATCDKYFKTTGVLKRHQMTHTGEKPHKCSVCGMAFSRPELVKAHLRKCH